MPNQSRANFFLCLTSVALLCALDGCRRTQSSSQSSSPGAATDNRLVGYWENVMGNDAGMIKIEFTPAGNLLVSVYRPASPGSTGGPMAWASEPRPAAFDTETGRWRLSGNTLAVDDDGTWDYSAQYPLEFLGDDEIVVGSKQGGYPGNYLHKLSGKWRRGTASRENPELSRLLATQDRLTQALENRRARKDSLLDGIRQIEAGSRKADGASTRRIYAQELYVLLGEMRAIEQTLQRIDSVIVRMRSALRMTQGRHELDKLPLGEDNRGQLFAQIVELDEQLKSATGTAHVSDAELDAVVEQARRNQR